MPKKLERKLKSEAANIFPNDPKRQDAYVYGTLRKTGWKPSKKNGGAVRDYKDEYKKFQSSKKMKNYRVELNKYNRQHGNYGNGDSKDATHNDGKITGYENQSTNRGRKDTMKKKYKKGGKVKKQGAKVAKNVVPKGQSMLATKAVKKAVPAGMKRAAAKRKILENPYVSPVKPKYKKGGEVDKDIKFKGGRKKVTPLSQESLPGKIRRKMGPDGPVGLVKDTRSKERRWMESAPPGERKSGDLPEFQKFYLRHADAEKKEAVDDTRYGESVREMFNPGFKTYLEEKHDTLVAPAKERMMSELRQRTAPSRKQGGEIPKMTNEGEVKQSDRLDRIRETLKKIIAIDRQTDRDLNPFFKNPKSDEEILASRKYGGPVVKNAGEPVAVYQASNSNYKEGE